jgi:hypothetical protein
MKLYSSKHEAALSEGIIHGVDEGEYASLDEAIEAMETAGYEEDDNGMFAWEDGDIIKVGWAV